MIQHDSSRLPRQVLFSSHPHDTRWWSTNCHSLPLAPALDLGFPRPPDPPFLAAGDGCDRCQTSASALQTAISATAAAVFDVEYGQDRPCSSKALVSGGCGACGAALKAVGEAQAGTDRSCQFVRSRLAIRPIRALACSVSLKGLDSFRALAVAGRIDFFLVLLRNQYNKIIR